MWEEKQRDPFTPIMLQEEECRAPPVGPSQLLRCNWILLPLAPQGYQPPLKLFPVLGKRAREWLRGAESDWGSGVGVGGGISCVCVACWCTHVSLWVYSRMLYILQFSFMQEEGAIQNSCSCLVRIFSPASSSQGWTNSHKMHSVVQRFCDKLCSERVTHPHSPKPSRIPCNLPSPSHLDITSATWVWWINAKMSFLKNMYP